MAPLGSLFTLPASWFHGATVWSAEQQDLAQQGAESTDARHTHADGALPQAPQQAIQTAAGDTSKASTSANTSAVQGAGSTCITCGIGVHLPAFASATEQRAHFKTDWHRLNIKRRLARQLPLGEEAFHAMLATQAAARSTAEGHASEVSISGDESSDESSDDEGGSASGAAVQRRRQRALHGAGTVPQVAFRAGDGTPFAMWRCVVARDKDKDKEALWAEGDMQGAMLKELQQLRSKAGMWVVLLLRGGHFAATIFRARPVGQGSTKGQHAQGQGGLEGFDVLAHKTFHRYVVRAKAGGKQSSADASGKFAKSAGAALRRYNESALEQDIMELLMSWSTELRAADLIFMQATASNARTLLDAAAAASAALVPGSGSAPPAPILASGDPRLRKVPFVTRRPTYAETKRVVSLLAAVLEPGQAAATALLDAQRSEALEAEAAATAAAAAADMQALSLSTALPGLPLPAGQAQVQAQAQQARDAAASEALRREAEKALDTPLHKAARQAEAERVARLLAAGGGRVHDPAAKDARGRTPYSMAADKATRDAFRRAMARDQGTEADPGPRCWDWTGAGVPSALTADMEAAQAAKKADKRAKLRAGREPDAGGSTTEATANSSSAQQQGAAAKQQLQQQLLPPAKQSKAEKEAAAAAAKAAALDAEVAAALAEANVAAARMASSHQAAPGRAAGGGGSGKVGAATAHRPGSSKKAGGSSKKASAATAAAAAAAAAVPLTPEEMARRRERAAAAAEERMRALQQASQAQKLW